MSGNDGIGFWSSFSGLTVENVLSTLWASPDTSSLLKHKKQHVTDMHLCL